MDHDPTPAAAGRITGVKTKETKEQQINTEDTAHEVHNTDPDDDEPPESAGVEYTDPDDDEPPESAGVGPQDDGNDAIKHQAEL